MGKDVRNQRDERFRVVLICSCKGCTTRPQVFLERNISDFSKRVVKSGKTVEEYLRTFVCKKCLANT